MKYLLAFLLFLNLGQLGSADALSDRLRSSVRSRYGGRMAYATIVPHKNLYFAAVANVDADTRNSDGRKTHWAVYEYTGGRWSYIFEFDSTVDADEESERLDRIFAKHRFSSEMRGKLMYGQERRL